MPKVVFFDLLHTLITPRRSIASQYARVFRRYLGPIQDSIVADVFPGALKEVQISHPAYRGGHRAWWGEVIRKTATAAGADSKAVEQHLPEVLEDLMHIYQTQEGYKLFDDVEETLKRLTLLGTQIGVVSNADSRMRNVLLELGVSQYLHPILLSSEEGVEKPAAEIWNRACTRISIVPGMDVFHVGDELQADYYGATNAGLRAVLLQRESGDRVPCSDDNVLRIKSLQELFLLDYFN